VVLARLSVLQTLFLKATESMLSMLTLASTAVDVQHSALLKQSLRDN
jgi:hypothetical protein